MNTLAIGLSGSLNLVVSALRINSNSVMGINDYDDIAALPSVDSVEPGDYLKANPSIQAQNNDRLIWNRSIIEAAYCIENGRADYCDNLTPVTLMFDP